MHPLEWVSDLVVPLLPLPDSPYATCVLVSDIDARLPDLGMAMVADTARAKNPMICMAVVYPVTMPHGVNEPSHLVSELPLDSAVNRVENPTLS